MSSHHLPAGRTLVIVGLIGACLVAALLAMLHPQGRLRAPGLASAQAAEPRRCAPGPNATGAPHSIEQVVDLINSLSNPVTVACFVESLDAPLKMSVTSDGPGANLLEMGVLQPGNRRALLGELRMPIQAEIRHALPYDRILEDVGTSCGFFCHQNEERDPRIHFAQAFLSKSIRASPDSEVTLDAVRGMLSRCQSPSASPRCELLHALLVTGRGQREDFPAEMPVGF